MATYTRPWDYWNGTASECIWAAGEWANKCDANASNRPITKPYYGWEIVIDDNSYNTGGFEKGWNYEVNGWLKCTGICNDWDYYANGYGYAAYHTLMNGLNNQTDQPDNWARWWPAQFYGPPQQFMPGYYEIFIFIPDDIGHLNTLLTWQANYVVKDRSLETHLIVDEYISPYQASLYINQRNKWLSLGVYYLDNLSWVYLLDSGEDSSHCPASGGGYTYCYVAADAVKFVPQTSIYLPVMK
jgi:hypothetical protein